MRNRLTEISSYRTIGGKIQNMTANPFMNDVAELLEARSGCISDITKRNLLRRYSRMEHDLSFLKTQGKIRKFTPSSITPDEVKAFILYRKEKIVNGKNISASDINHDISALDQLCLFRGNAAVGKCLATNPGLKPRDKKNGRLEPLSESTYEKILEKYYSFSEEERADISIARPYAMVLMYIGTGARNKEIRLAKRSDLNTSEWTIFFQHVKGEDTYGEPRNVPIPDEIRPVVENYLLASEAWLICHKVKISSVEPLFFKLGGDYGYLSSNGIRKIKTRIERDIGQKFELRDCRRAFGQHYLNNDAALDDVSVLMGHATTRTTELYYCRKSDTEAIKNVKGKW